MNKNNNNHWIGSSLGKGNAFTGFISNKPHNFFKSDKKDMPVNMFKDKDGDGVANVFDCKPGDPSRQGFVDAVIGAVKAIGSGTGEVKRGWKEGMAQHGNAVTRKIESNYQHRREIQRNKLSDEEQQRRIADRLEKEVRRKQIQQAATGVGNKIFLAAKRANPKYDMAVEYRYKKIKTLQGQLKDPNLTKKQAARLGRQLQNKQQIQEYRNTQLQQTASGQVQKSFVRGVVQAFPTVYAMSGKHVMGAPGQRGRPRGSLDERYRVYGGVYGYRKYIGAQKKALRLQLQQQQMAMKTANQPQYERQQYQQMQPQQVQQQVPQEMQGQNVATDYSQFQQEQGQQVPQQVQQYQQPQQVPIQQQQPQQRQIATVFKSSGGSPYPPVPRQGLAPTNQTIPYGYVESVDSFTGRRFLKPLPKPEAWVR